MSVPPILLLPKDSIKCILEFLTPPDIARLSQVSRQLRSLLSDDKIWENCCKNHFGQGLHAIQSKAIAPGKFKEFYSEYHKQKQPLRTWITTWKIQCYYRDWIAQVNTTVAVNAAQQMVYVKDQLYYLDPRTKQLYVTNAASVHAEDFFKLPTDKYTVMTTDGTLIYALTTDGVIHVLNPETRTLLGLIPSGMREIHPQLRDYSQDEISLLDGHLQIRDTQMQRYNWLTADNQPLYHPYHRQGNVAKHFMYRENGQCSIFGDGSIGAFLDLRPLSPGLTREEPEPPLGTEETLRLAAEKLTTRETLLNAKKPATEGITAKETGYDTVTYYHFNETMNWSSVYSARDQWILCHELPKDKTAIYSLSFDEMFNSLLWRADHAPRLLEKRGEAPFNFGSNTVLWKETILLTLAQNAKNQTTAVHGFDILSGKHATISTTHLTHETLELKMRSLAEEIAEKLETLNLEPAAKKQKKE